MQTMKRKTWAVVALVAVIAVIAVAACQAPPAVPTMPTGPVHVVLDNAYEIGASGEMPASAAGDTNLTNLVASGDVTIGGGLTVTGGVTGTNVLTTGNQTVGGVKTFTDTGTFSGAVTVGGGYGSTGCTLSAAGVLQCNGAATIDGAATVTGALTAASVSAKVPVLAKTASYAVLATDTGSTIKSTGSITMTLPAAAAGLHYCLVNYDGGDLTIDVTDTADVFLNEVNSPGDRVTNTTAYDSICVTAIDAVNWMTISSLGTWSDGN